VLTLKFVEDTNGEDLEDGDDVEMHEGEWEGLSD
jgi:uncharacterized Zn ribbon protein